MYRIRKTDKGFVVEFKHAKWTLFGIKWTWKPFLTYLGHTDAFPFSNTTAAKEKLVSEILKLVDNEQ